ncbi:hypothetical protein FHS27_001815 [Rhodopirellula rubra]|uniref:Uncharacterized protein n=1 Tax=Aporhodopirellula rubra TaxID=980271 RepID=A0A7W5DXI1_9BACT|nr:hypothetical protein [Aporhodopirellula rubra]MBB3206007.1 hypothetical protein [Aporhodopirellula rubra]
MNESNLQAVQESLSTAAIPIALLVLVLCVGSFLVAGYSMKFALLVAGVGRFGFWKSIGVVLVTGLMSMFVTFSIVFAMPGEPVAGLIAGVASIGSYAVIVSLVGQCGIGRGLMTYFLNGIFNLVGTVPLATVLFLGGFAIAKTSDLDQIDFESLRKDLAMAQGNLPVGEEGEGLENAFGGFDITQVSGTGFDDGFAIAGDAQPASLPKQLPSLVPADDSSNGIFNSFFKEEKSSPYPVPAASGCRSGCSKNNPSLPKKSEPVTSGLQSNPFAK